METPEFFQGTYDNTQFAPEKRHSDAKPGDHFIIEDLLDYPNDDVAVDDGTFDTVAGTSTEYSSTVTAVESCNSSSFSVNEPHFSGEMGCRSFSDGQFSSDLCVPYDDLAELEWLSNFVEESFSSEDLQKLHLISGRQVRTDEVSESHQTSRNTSIFHPEMSFPGKARSKRSRAAPCNWTTRLSVVSSTNMTTMASSSDSGIGSSTGEKTVKEITIKKEATDNAGNTSGGDGRKCLHCATDKTPQWRTGPMGPKTLCNACGVRYKSGRLVPEYRPAASPTFVLTKHSNSHRKVIELRRQKEVQRARQQQQHQFLHQNMMFDLSKIDDYLIHQQTGPNFHQLI
ncbi:unnamed protein product [Ilex paraguariensis]|uniref:GATA transcription factor n=1 Tax=Ilex paraguariensis TaxID=185542 RepID=A0ABC8UUX6_9AQUA